MVTVRRARADELAWVNRLYLRADFVRSDENDRVLVAEHEGERVGVGRLVPAGEGHVELGGMFVLEEHRGLGAARALVAALLEEAGDRTVWCIPYARVAGLYRSFGLLEAPEDLSPPPAVVEKLRFCRARYALAVVLLVKPGAAARA